MTEDKHQIPVDSIREQKRIAIDRYKLPEGLLKKSTFTGMFSAEAIGYVVVDRIWTWQESHVSRISPGTPTIPSGPVSGIPSFSAPGNRSP